MEVHSPTVVHTSLDTNIDKLPRASRSKNPSFLDRDTTLFLFSHTKSTAEMPNMQLCQIPFVQHGTSKRADKLDFIFSLGKNWIKIIFYNMRSIQEVAYKPRIPCRISC